MRFLLLLLLLSGMFQAAVAQGYNDSILAYRQKYKLEFLEDKRSPLKAEDTSFLRFFAPDRKYRVKAVLTLTPDAAPFDMPTASGKNKQYRKYGNLQFTLSNRQYQLEVYQSLDLMKKEEYKDHLFIPFKDLTNYETTYGGGRYLDISITDISEGRVVLDFNKAYNPWCAFASGYSCPIPPDANKITVAIEAGEKNLAKEIEH